MKYIKLFENFYDNDKFFHFPNIFNPNIDKRYMEKLLSSYLETALWAENFGDNSIYDFSEDSIIKAKEDLNKLIELLSSKFPNLELTTKLTPDIIGHNFFLSRNGHGSGFFDEDYPNDLPSTIGDDIQDLVGDEFSEIYLEEGDDEKIFMF